MEDSGSSTEVEAKPLIVRVKRKIYQSPLEGLWLEINQRPFKRPLVDFAQLSIGNADEKGVEINENDFAQLSIDNADEKVKLSMAKKVLVQHVETVGCSEDSVVSILQYSSKEIDAWGSKLRSKVEERSRTCKQGNKQDELLLKSRQNHEALAKNARFQQIWKKRNQVKATILDHQKTFLGEKVGDVCQLYDVVRVDVEEEKQNHMGEPEYQCRDLSPEDIALLQSYLPLLEDSLPSAAAQIHNDMQSYFLTQGSTDGFVYDLYIVSDELSTTDKEVLDTYPLVQVDYIDKDYYDGPDNSDHDSDDSNAEDNPLNDYPDEEEETEDESENKDDNEDDDDDEDKTSQTSSSGTEAHDFKKHGSDSSDSEYDYNGRGYYFNPPEDQDLDDYDIED